MIIKSPFDCDKGTKAPLPCSCLHDNKPHALGNRRIYDYIGSFRNRRYNLKFSAYLERRLTSKLYQMASYEHHQAQYLGKHKVELYHVD